MTATDELGAIFDAPAPLTVGIEEEVMLLDPATLDLAPVAPSLLESLAGDERFKLEMPASQLEIVSPPFADAGAAARFLERARGDLGAAAAGVARLACAGVHPFAAAEGELNAGERYRQTAREYGWIARRQLVHALQIHVCVRGADRALAVYNALRSYLPELLALAANAPFYRGEDTGLASLRPKLCELLPRQGVPPAISSWPAHAAELDWGVRSGALGDPRGWWWELRPQPIYGTIEVRVPDAQTTVADVAGVTAVVHALAAELAARHDAGEPLPTAPTWRIEQNRWRALRGGSGGTLADLETGTPVATSERLHGLIDSLERSAGALSCGRELAHARALVERGGAERQRLVARSGGMRGLGEWLTDRFLAPLA